MTSKDPHAAREAAKYDQPIPSREYIIQRLESLSEPATHEELCELLDIAGDSGREALRRRLRAMQRDGQLLSNRRGAFGLISKMDLVRGRVQGHRDGFGFLIPDDGADDLFVSQRQMNKVLDGDRVLARRADYRHRDKNEAVIVEVLERAHTHLVGRYYLESGVGFVVPENARINQDILVTDESRDLAKQGQVVSVEIMHYPGGRNNAVGRIVEVLGEHLAPGMEIDIALRSYDIPFEWPDSLSHELRGIDKDISDAELAQRVDLRSKPFVTIDGEDARDFDDAVFCERKPTGGWLLYVAIADVSHYVKVCSALDQEAQARGTSVYFPERVVPMLPELLSNDLCSLNPHVDRLTMVCEINIDAHGNMGEYRFCEAVIQSHARLTYTRVSKMLEKSHTKAGAKLRDKYADLVQPLDELYVLYKTLSRGRAQRGAIEFETSETRIVFGEARKIEEIVEVERNQAHRLIEECMLCANVAAADFLMQHKLPGLYRVHDGPTEEKLKNLRDFLAELGLSLRGGERPSPKDYQLLSQQIQGRTDMHLVQTVMLRSMQQAVYSPDNNGHFGLAYEGYTHFTSPIRRYPDLLVHRAIRSVIRSRRKSRWVQRVPGAKSIQKKTIYPYDLAEMDRLGDQCSQYERRADDAVRDVVGWLKCEYMQEHIGEVFEGVISGVTAFGLFIELKGVFVEGLLHVSALKNDYYHFDPVKHRLTGEHSHFSYSLGDPVTVRVMGVNLEDRKIDFELPVQEKVKKHKKQKGRRNRRGKR